MPPSLFALELLAHAGSGQEGRIHDPCLFRRGKSDYYMTSLDLGSRNPSRSSDASLRHSPLIRALVRSCSIGCSLSKGLLVVLPLGWRLLLCCPSCRAEECGWREEFPPSILTGSGRVMVGARWRGCKDGSLLSTVYVERLGRSHRWRHGSARPRTPDKNNIIPRNVETLISHHIRNTAIQNLALGLDNGVHWWKATVSHTNWARFPLSTRWLLHRRRRHAAGIVV